tara:strand:+ start:456 stop:956 length:501 start_codon:yes stop_codon:yes gene_type:complete
MRPFLTLILIVGSLTSTHAQERTLLVVGPGGSVLTELKSNESTSIRLTDQLGQSVALSAADPAKGFVRVLDGNGKAVVLGQDIQSWSAKLEGEETKHLIQVIVFNVAKGIAIIVALLILRAIIAAIGKGVAEEEEKSRAHLLKEIGELEAELADKEIELAKAARGN